MIDEEYSIEQSDSLIEDPVISVVLPTCNSELLLQRCIDSIISQTFTKWELVVVNEYGCIDKTEEIVKKYLRTDNRIVFVQLRKKYGLARSLNLGIQLSRADIVARIDSDDYSNCRRFE